MTGYELAVFAAKLAFGTLAFLLIGYLGSSSDKRIAGTMLTFPVLNGIGLVTTPDKDPAALIAAMMPMIALNAWLCFGFITAFRAIERSRRATDDRTNSYGIAMLGAAIWFAVAALLLLRIEPALPSSTAIAGLFWVTTVVLTPWLWSSLKTAGSSPQTAVQNETRATFFAFWRARGWRFAFFLASLFVLLVAAEISNAAWVGRLSALPLVPLCVLAGLAIDEPASLPALRDPILIGPGLAMLFVLSLAAILGAIHDADGLRYWGPGMGALIAGWALCIVVIRFGVPRLAAMLDRWKLS